MARCFLTGVEFRVEEGHVLNRTDAHRLMTTLTKRAESLERLLAQLTPLDVSAADDPRSHRRAGSKQHRMICKAMADALARAYPEIELFLTWPALLARNVKDRMRLLKEHPLYGAAISSLSDQELIKLARLGQQVVSLIDPGRALPPRATVAVRAGICVRHRTESARHIAALIRATVSGNGDLVALGVANEEHEPVKVSLLRVIGAPPQIKSGHE